MTKQERSEHQDEILVLDLCRQLHLDTFMCPSCLFNLNERNEINSNQYPA